MARRMDRARSWQRPALSVTEIGMQMALAKRFIDEGIRKFTD